MTVTLLKYKEMASLELGNYSIFVTVPSVTEANPWSPSERKAMGTPTSSLKPRCSNTCIFF